MKLDILAGSILGRPHGTPGAYVAEEEKLPCGYIFLGDKFSNITLMFPHASAFPSILYL
jgi:hypothetical protein